MATITARQTNGRRTRKTALDFEKFAAEGERFILEVARELGCSRNAAARITRVILHALRDRLPADDAIEFAQGLPMALKAVFIDQYDPSITPISIRHKLEFLEFIYDRAGLTAARDFPDDYAIERALQTVFQLLRHHMDPGQVAQIKKLLGRNIADMVDGYPYFLPN